MKSLFIAGDINRIGGIEKYNRDFYYALMKADTNTVLVERWEGGIIAKFSFVFRVLWTYFKEHPDIIFCGHLNFSPICLALKLLFRTPYTIALYGIEIIESHGWLKRRAVLGAERVITISEYSRRLILRQYPDLNERIVMLPSAVDGSVFFIKKKNQNLLDKFGIAGRPIILSLARLSTPEHKGQDRVLASLPYVLEKIPNAVYLIIGGGTDERVNRILRKQPELANSVIIAGPASNEERTDYYNLADVYVLPAKYEGFSIVFIESLACGVPVIASDGYGCREGLLNGELGLLVPPDDLQAIASAIITILTGSSHHLLIDRKQLRKRTLDIYGIDAWNQRVYQLVKELSPRRSKRKLAIFMSHPIQYQTPLLGRLAKNEHIATHTYFYWDFGVKETYEEEFNRKIKWDITVLDGYQYTFLRNYSIRPSSKFWGAVNFGVISEIILHRYDAILVFGWALFSNWLAILSARISGTRIILYGESPMNQEYRKKEGLKHLVRNMVLRNLFKHISAFLYIGEENKKFYEHFRVPQNKLFFAPYAVDNERYFNEQRSLSTDKIGLRKSAGIAEKGPVILFVGKLSEKKRPIDLMKAYEILLKSWTGRDNPVLVYVGDGPLRVELEDYVANHGLVGVFFTGFKNQLELSSYYAIADVFVLPSGLGETWGLVVNEAMCFGVPVIVSDMVGCGADIVKHGENGFVFPLGDCHKLAQYLAVILNDEKTRKTFGRRSREIIESYNQERGVKGIQEALYV